MNNFFVNVENLGSAPNKEVVSNSEWNNSESFFTNQDEGLYIKTAKEKPIVDECKHGFFMNETDTNNFIRNYSKGKSFKFSEWNELDTYNNDEFVQDWVTHKGVLWVCNITNTNHEPELKSEFWTKVLSAEGLIELTWSNFEMSE